MQKLNKLFLSFLFFWLCMFIAKAQDEKIKALFIYNFTKYIEWPANAKQGTFVIGVLGETPVFDQLVANTSTRKVSTQEIVVKKYSKASEIEKCHIIYVPHDKSGNVKDILNRVKDWPTLIITDSPGMINTGSGLNFIMSNGRQSFEINTEYLDLKKLIYNSTLLKLGVKVK